MSRLYKIPFTPVEDYNEVHHITNSDSETPIVAEAGRRLFDDPGLIGIELAVEVGNKIVGPTQAPPSNANDGDRL